MGMNLDEFWRHMAECFEPVLGPQPPDEEDVRHREHRLHDHLQPHGDGQDEDRPLHGWLYPTSAMERSGEGGV